MTANITTIETLTEIGIKCSACGIASTHQDRCPVCLTVRPATSMGTRVLVAETPQQTIAEIDNALVQQKNNIIALADAGTEHGLETAELLLAFVSELWSVAGYGYKIGELWARIKRNREHLGAQRKAERQAKWAAVKAKREAKKLAS